MTDRFQKLYSLTPYLYTEGCPVLIEAGALQKDTESGAVLAQIKMQNIGEKTIASCKVSVMAYENNGNRLEGVEGFSYLDLNADPGTQFGSRTPVFLPDNTTRKINVAVTEIVFSDGTVQKEEEKNWKQIPERRPIATVLDSPELVAQFSAEIGCKAELAPAVKEGLFLCSCGNINLDSVQKCNHCGNTIDSLNKLMDKEYLESRVNERKKQEADAVARKVSKQKAVRKKVLKGTIVLAIVIAVYMVNMIRGMNSILPDKVTWDDTYKQVERKIGADAEKYGTGRLVGETKHLGYNGEAVFNFDVNSDLLQEVYVWYDEDRDTLEKVLTKKYGDPQDRSSNIIIWIYKDTEISLGESGVHCYVAYTKTN